MCMPKYRNKVVFIPNGIQIRMNQGDRNYIKALQNFCLNEMLIK
jgi:hypothetical protein